LEFYEETSEGKYCYTCENYQESIQNSHVASPVIFIPMLFRFSAAATGAIFYVPEGAPPAKDQIMKAKPILKKTTPRTSMLMSWKRSYFAASRWGNTAEESLAPVLAKNLRAIKPVSPSKDIHKPKIAVGSMNLDISQ
jgi:hypothetical protein